jgi:hypothetical protein
MFTPWVMGAGVWDFFCVRTMIGTLERWLAFEEVLIVPYLLKQWVSMKLLTWFNIGTFKKPLLRWMPRSSSTPYTTTLNPRIFIWGNIFKQCARKTKERNNINRVWIRKSENIASHKLAKWAGIEPNKK